MIKNLDIFFTAIKIKGRELREFSEFFFGIDLGLGTSTLAQLEENYCNIMQDDVLRLSLLDSIRNMRSSEFKCRENIFLQKLVDLIEDFPNLKFCDGRKLFDVLIEQENDDVDDYLIEKISVPASKLHNELSLYLSRTKRSKGTLIKFIPAVLEKIQSENNRKRLELFAKNMYKEFKDYSDKILNELNDELNDELRDIFLKT